MNIALFTTEGLIMVLRWMHFFAGVVWIGHLYFLNFVQGAFMPEVDATVKNNVFAKLVPKVMFWFRWGAMGTFVSGVLMLWLSGFQFDAEILNSAYGIYIYTGALLGTLMFLNVWLIIWPRQKIMIANGQGLLAGQPANPEVAKLAPQALLASRTNVLFSIPLLFFMGASRHLSLEMAEGFSSTTLLIVLTAIILGLELNAIKGKLGPLTTVKGVIHCGLGLLVVLYGLIEFMA